jgi:hypothetical protein
MRKLAVLLLISCAASAQQTAAESGLAPETLLLARIKLQMTESLARQPNYTCLETVERTRRPKGGRAQVQDTLRIEVALVNGKEMFAWPGSKAFEDKDLSDLVTTGTFGNGNFALHARSVFMGSAPTFVHRGEEMLNGHSAVRYDFHVPRLLSGYTLRVNRKEAIVGYHGSFWADPQSLDVRRLIVYADDIPKELNAESTADRVDYGRLDIGGSEFLLPVESVLEMTVPEWEYRNFVRFTNCRQYTGESVLRFTGEVPPDAPPAVMEEVELPPSVTFQIGLAGDADLPALAVGDSITAELRADVKHKRHTLIPKGAAVRGRITRMEWHPDHTVVGLTFSDLDWSGKHAALHGTLLSVTGIVYAGVDPRRWPSYPPARGEGILRLPPGQKKLIRGMLFYWSNDR